MSLFEFRKGFSIIFPEKFRYNSLTVYERKNFSGSSFHHICELYDFWFPFYPHRAECLLFSGHLLPVQQSLSIRHFVRGRYESPSTIGCLERTRMLINMM